ncbi:sporulation related domain protein [Rhodobiaceae bacterium]|nr:sporulation related domain protein [Rhodobiaceae bacterium]
MANMGRGSEEHYELDATDEFHTYDATDGGGGGRTLFVLLGLLFAVILFGGVLYLAYQQGMREGARNAPPVIEADGSPVKVAPDDPGGMEIPNTDKLIYDRMNGEDPAEPGVEQLLPRAEEPMTVEDRTPAPKPEPADPMPVQPPALDIVPDPEAIAAGEAQVPAEGADIIPVPVAPASRGDAAVPPPTVLPPVAVPDTPPAVQPSANGRFVIQIAAFRDQVQAAAGFARLRTAYPDLVAGLTPDVERADLGDRGIYFRLRLGAFQTKDAATALCTRLKGRGQDCIVKER